MTIKCGTVTSDLFLNMTNNEGKRKDTSTQDTEPLSDKGKFSTRKGLSATKLLRDAFPTSGINVTAELSSLMNNVNGSKASSSSSSRTSNAAFLNTFEESGSIIQKAGASPHQESEKLNEEYHEWGNLDNSNNDMNDMAGHSFRYRHYEHGKDDVSSESGRQEQEKVDGGKVLDFLNSNLYTVEIYDTDKELFSGNNLQMESETQNLNELNKFMESSDIITYLNEIRYTDDVYGNPFFLKRLIKEAKDELKNGAATDAHQHVAIKRLKMVKDHLIKIKERKEREGNLGKKDWTRQWDEQDIKVMELLWND